MTKYLLLVFFFGVLVIISPAIAQIAPRPAPLVPEINSLWAEMSLFPGDIGNMNNGRVWIEHGLNVNGGPGQALQVESAFGGAALGVANTGNGRGLVANSIYNAGVGGFSRYGSGVQGISEEATGVSAISDTGRALYVQTNEGPEAYGIFQVGPDSKNYFEAPLILSTLAGTSTAYVCATSAGQLYRSLQACI